MLEILIIIGFIALDQVSKYLSELFLAPLGTSYPLWEGVFHFTSAHNKGAAFGMFSGGRWIFIAITIIVCIVVAWILIRKRKDVHILFRIALSFVLAGAVGNLIDRVILGYVRDMLDFCLIDFAIFNVADSALCIGALLLAIDLLFIDGDVLFQETKKRNVHHGES